LLCFTKYSNKLLERDYEIEDRGCWKSYWYNEDNKI